jgi:hypothetical protein
VNIADKIKLARLKRDIAAGIDDLEQGRFKTYHDPGRLASEINRSGRRRLESLRRRRAGKTQRM